MKHATISIELWCSHLSCRNQGNVSFRIGTLLEDVQSARFSSAWSSLLYKKSNCELEIFAEISYLLVSKYFINLSNTALVTPSTAPLFNKGNSFVLKNSSPVYQRVLYCIPTDKRFWCPWTTRITNGLGRTGPHHNQIFPPIGLVGPCSSLSSPLCWYLTTARTRACWSFQWGCH